MNSIRRLLRFWFTFDEPVNRAAYVLHGALLVLAKYAGDALLVYAGTGRFWTPPDYIRAKAFVLAAQLQDGSPYLAPILVLWTLPFLWAGVTLTIRRLYDAGLSAWWSLLFFIPVLNYLMIVWIIALPTVPVSAAPPKNSWMPSGARLPKALLAVAAGSAVGLGLVWLSVGGLQTYGLALFVGAPFIIGIVTGYVLCRSYPATRRDTHGVVAITLLIVAAVALAVGVEGAVCLLMVAPLGLVIALLGGITGRHFALREQSALAGALFVSAVFPLAMVLEPQPPTFPLREVRSSVEIDAPPADVWERVIAFPPITTKLSLLFKLGIAYPKHATIRGSGVGATRYCVFSTGAFVEPITVWEPGKRLAFDVVESPPPLRELSFWSVKPPHLSGYLVPTRGEFRLTALPDGRTRLVGTTWYEQRLRPQGYWVLYSDYFIGAIHRRVLEHIKAVTEQQARPMSHL